MPLTIVCQLVRSGCEPAPDRRGFPVGSARGSTQRLPASWKTSQNVLEGVPGGLGRSEGKIPLGTAQKRRIDVFSHRYRGFWTEGPARSRRLRRNSIVPGRRSIVHPVPCSAWHVLHVADWPVCMLDVGLCSLISALWNQQGKLVRWKKTRSARPPSTTACRMTSAFFRSGSGVPEIVLSLRRTAESRLFSDQKH